MELKVSLTNFRFIVDLIFSIHDLIYLYSYLEVTEKKKNIPKNQRSNDTNSRRGRRRSEFIDDEVECSDNDSDDDESLGEDGKLHFIDHLVIYLINSTYI